jgi:hypothetical protein
MPDPSWESPATLRNVAASAAAPALLPAQGRMLKDYAMGEDLPPRVDVLDFFWAPLNLYVELTVPNVARPAAADHISLRVSALREGAPVFFWNIPAPPANVAARTGCRRLVAMMSCPRGGYDMYEVQLLIAGGVAASMRFERRFGADRLIGGVARRPSDSRISPLLITGTQKSGTTWVETIVDTRADVLMLHEGNSLNTLEHRATRANFEERLQEFRSRGFITWRPAFPIAEELTMFTQIAVARTLFDLLGSTFNFPIVADRTPGSSESYHFLVKFWRECRYLHIVRHPLDVFVSRLFHEAALGRGPNPGMSRLDRQVLGRLIACIDALGDREASPGQLIDDDALRDGAYDIVFDQWKVDQQKFLEVQPFAAERFLLVRYEDLAGDLEHTISGIMQFIGRCGGTAIDAQATAAATSFRTMSGGRRPGEEDRRSFFRNGRTGDRHRYLSPAQHALLWARVGPLAARFGYGEA